jgi:hypothetical protein
MGKALGALTRADDPFRALTDMAVEMVDGAEFAGITRSRADRLETVAATDPLARVADAIQYALGNGPCVDAVLQKTVFMTGDLRTDPRWPEFGRRAFDETGIVSMLSFRLYLEDDDLLAGLNMYSTTPNAFDSESTFTGTLLATHGSIAVALALSRVRVAHLERALNSNREIGVAMGVIMSQYKVTQDQAFDLLRVASQHTHRKLVDVAAAVVDTGQLDLPESMATQVD